MSWFLNSWESILPKNEENNKKFRNIMGSMNFLKMLIVSILTISGGLLLYGLELSPHFIFLVQSFIAFTGLIFGYSILVDYNPIKIEKNQDVKFLEKSNLSIADKNKNLKHLILGRYLSVTPYFLSFCILNFSSISFFSIQFPLIVYEIVTNKQWGVEQKWNMDFTSLALVFLSLISSITDLIYGISCKMSSNFSNNTSSPFRRLILLYILSFPLAWFSFFIILFLNVSLSIKLIIVVLLFIMKLTTSGLASGLYWQIYLEITQAEFRSSQESYFNTFNLLLSTIGFTVIGMIIEDGGLLNSLLFLFLISVVAILFLVLVGEPQARSNNLNHTI